MERAFLEQGNHELRQGKYQAAINSYRQAIAHFEDYLELVNEYKKLEKQLKKPKLPNLPHTNQARLQTEYEELLEYFVELQKANANLSEDNKALRGLVNLLAVSSAKQRKRRVFSRFLALTKQIFSKKPTQATHAQTTNTIQMKTETIHALIPLLFIIFLVL